MPKISDDHGSSGFALRAVAETIVKSSDQRFNNRCGNHETRFELATKSLLLPPSEYLQSMFFESSRSLILGFVNNFSNRQA